MKKTLLLALTLVLFSGAFAQKNKKDVVQLKTEADTISYAYGATLVQQGLLQHLQQQGVVADTASIRKEYEEKIKAETNPSKVKELNKELTSKLNDTNKSNQANVTRLLNAITVVMAADEQGKGYKEGLMIGQQFVQMIPSFSHQLYGGEENKINQDLFFKGLKAALTGDKVLVENGFELINGKMEAAQLAAAEKSDKDAKEKNAANIAEGEKFLQENKAKEGVVTLPSGLQYKILTEGTGEKPVLSDQVSVHYRGSLIDGTVFDSSRERGEPTTLGLTQVIKGWTEALQLMPVGSKWMLYVPYELGYGSRDMGKIKPFSTLIFEIELLSIEQ